MPNIKSAKKRTKIIAAKTLKNKMFTTNLKTVVKKYESAAAASDKSGLDQSYRAAVKKIDQAVARGLMHKNKAARKKSQFAKKYASLS
jgi:small subunit ribosomal protein S20